MLGTDTDTDDALPSITLAILEASLHELATANAACITANERLAIAKANNLRLIQRTYPHRTNASRRSSTDPPPPYIRTNDNPDSDISELT